MQVAKGQRVRDGEEAEKWEKGKGKARVRGEEGEAGRGFS